MRQMRAIGNNHTHLTHYPSLSNEHVSIPGGDDRTHLQSKPNRVNSCALAPDVQLLANGWIFCNELRRSSHRRWSAQGQPELVEEVWSMFTLSRSIDHNSSQPV